MKEYAKIENCNIKSFVSCLKYFLNSDLIKALTVRES